MNCEGCIYSQQQELADVLKCTECKRAYQEDTPGHKEFKDLHSEDEAEKRCWNCKHTDEEYHCWCDLTGENIILDMTVEDTRTCEDFESIK